MNKYLLEFKNYYEEQLSNQEFIAKDENNERLREEFIKEYSIDKIRKLSLDEYILGKDKLSLSYQLEFGKYSKAVCSIAGYRSYMHGIWYKKEDNNYYTRSEGRIVILDNPQGYWVEFRKDLTEYLEYAKDNEIIISVKEMYPKLQYMPRALCKYLAAYYPDKFINISSKQVYKKLMDLFGFEYKIDDSNELLSYKLNKAIRNEIIEVNENSNYLLGLILYKFYEERYSEEPTKIQNSENDNQMYDEWWPKNYSPNISIEEWITLLTDTEIFYTSSLEIMKRIKDIGGEATCKQLSEKYGEAINFYNAGSSSLARRIAKKTNCQIMVKDNGDSKWWPILYVGKEASFDEKGTWIWKLRKELYEALDRADLSNIALFSKHEKNTESSIKDKNDKYSKEDFLNEVYMDENKYKTIVSVMKNKKNIILQGAPGVGKTYCAKRLAYSLMGMKDDSKIEFIQFHQSYSYEDFVMGYRPIENGFELGYGPFYSFCEKAKDDPNNDYYFIIDEINRGNLSKIFGELFMLIENDKRDQYIRLIYGNKLFTVPKNIYIIGLMNTADRSLAMLDYALRRRFAFIDIEPAFDNDKFKNYLDNIDNENLNRVIELIKEINNDISDDESLGKGFRIGHSYFIADKNKKDINEWLSEIIEYEIIPLINEYWFDNQETVNHYVKKLKDALR